MLKRGRVGGKEAEYRGHKRTVQSIFSFIDAERKFAFVQVLKGNFTDFQLAHYGSNLVSK